MLLHQCALIAAQNGSDDIVNAKIAYGQILSSEEKPRNSKNKTINRQSIEHPQNPTTRVHNNIELRVSHMLKVWLLWETRGYGFYAVYGTKQ